MGIKLKDIIDLDYFLSLDEKSRLNDQEENYIRIRDRSIFKEIAQNRENATKQQIKEWTDKELIFAWLEKRKKQKKNEKTSTHLPGKTVDVFFYWARKFAFILSFLIGFGTIYSFLAYHGVQPVNISLFTAFFILIPFLMSLCTIIVPICNRLINKMPVSKNKNLFSRYGFLFFFVFKLLPGLLEKRWMGNIGQTAAAKLKIVFSIIAEKKPVYQQLLFWPLLELSSIVAMGFSLGTLGGTLFRIITSDMAFGWQSSLTAGSSCVQDIVSWIAIPWSWAIPDAVPTFEQIQGSRIILKQGIQSLSTKSLVAWWPFLSMGILCYAVLPRMILVFVFKLIADLTCKQFNLNETRIRRILIRMQSPLFDQEFKKKRIKLSNEKELSINKKLELVKCSEKQIQVDTNKEKEKSQNIEEPIIVDSVSENKDTAGITIDESPYYKKEAKEELHKLKKCAMLLSSSHIFDDIPLDGLIKAIEGQLLVNICKQIILSGNIKADLNTLIPLGKEEIPVDQVIILQEVWQPPIKGLLYYFVQLADTVFKNKMIWILLVQTPGSEVSDKMDGNDENDFHIWQRAVENLNHPNITAEGLIEYGE